MPRHSVQAPGSVVMIRPHCFTPNPHTVADNAFQSRDYAKSWADLAAAAYREVSVAAEALRALGIEVHLFEDESTLRPDSVFPNNWFSTHSGGQVAIYPMFSPSRRPERRHDVIELLKQRYFVQHVIDYSALEHDGIFLEGTGAMVLDHLERVAYATRSNRMSELALERFCTHFAMEPFVFESADSHGRPVYHTNVLMCIGTEFCLVALQAIRDERRRSQLRERLERSGRAIIELSLPQVYEFAGNAIELSAREGPVAVLSSRALRVLLPEQRRVLERCARTLPLDVPTIELAGGSVRCMLAGVHLTPRPAIGVHDLHAERLSPQVTN